MFRLSIIVSRLTDFGSSIYLVFVSFGGFFGFGFFVRHARQIHIKSTALVNFADSPDSTAVKLDDFAANKQPQTGAANGTGGRAVDPVKLLE